MGKANRHTALQRGGGKGMRGEGGGERGEGGGGSKFCQKLRYGYVMVERSLKCIAKYILPKT